MPAMEELSNLNLLAEPARLEALGEVGLLDEESSPSLDRLARVTRTALVVPVALVSLVDDHRQFFTSQCGLAEPWASSRETPLSHSFCQHVVLTHAAFVVTDAREDPRVRGNLAIRDLSVIAYAGMPIVLHTGEVVGSLCAIDSVPRQWSERELDLLRDLASAASDELDLRRRAYQAEQAEQALRGVIGSLEQAHTDSRQTVREVQHDIRSPLSVISMGVATLLRYEGAQALPELMRMLRVLERNAEQAAALSNQLTRGADAQTVERIDLAALVAQVCEAAAMQAPNLALSVDRPRPLIVEADRVELLRCVENIVDNALRFARTRVAVRLGSRAGVAELRVEDDGPGLASSKEYAQAWDPAVRFHQSTGKSGSGLGLFVVRTLIGRYAGTVVGEPSGLGGASFGFLLPLAG